MKSLLLSCLVVSSAILVTGCGSADDAKGEAAVARLQNRAKPGFIRVLNLTSGSIDVYDKERPISKGIPSQGISAFNPISSGDRKLKVGNKEIKLNLENGVCATIVAYESREPEILLGEVRYADPAGNLQVALAIGDGSKSSFSKKVTGGSAALTVEAREKGVSPTRYSLDIGEYTVDGQPLSVAKDCSYTILVVPGSKGSGVFALRNTPNLEAKMGGIAAN